MPLPNKGDQDVRIIWLDKHRRGYAQTSFMVWHFHVGRAAVIDLVQHFGLAFGRIPVRQERGTG